MHRSQEMNPTPRRRALLVKAAGLAFFLSSVALLAGGFLPSAHDVPFELPLLWPEEQRAFLQDGPGLLLKRPEVEELVNLDEVGRGQWIARFLTDPLPETAANELALGIERRRWLIRRELLNYVDDRSRLLFLHGAPEEREVVDCGGTFKPLEMWTYPGAAEGESTTLVLYQEKVSEPYRLWLPLDSKRVLYEEEMEYWLEQWEELRHLIRGNARRFDYQICPRSTKVDWVTGVDGLFGFLPNRPTNEELAALLEPPSDLAAWAAKAAEEPMQMPKAYVVDPATAKREAKLYRKGKIDDYAQTTLDEPLEDLGDRTGSSSAAEEEEELYEPEVWPPPLGEAELDLFFPERQSQRMLTRMLVKIPETTKLEPYVEDDKQELRIVVEGHLEHGGKIFDSFRVRYLMTPPDEGVPVALQADKLLRPEQEFLLRLKVTEEISGTSFFFDRGFKVPRTPTPAEDMPAVPDEVMVALAEKLRQNRVSGYDSLILVPPETDVVLGLWRAEALVTGANIEKVVFYLDDKEQMSRRRPPFTAELRLETYPTEQVVRAEGYDVHDRMLASDEVILNQPRGELRVRILAPVRGRRVSGEVKARAEVVVPEEARVARVTFSVNEELVAEVVRPPWEAKIQVPEYGEINYLTVAAELEDGQRAEEVRFLNAPEHLEEVDVNLVELYTTVADKSGILVRGLEASQFEVTEDGQPQKIEKFELVENLPLTLGIVLDTSGSMFESMVEAKRAAVGFLENIITPRDRCFAVAFSTQPVLLMPRTSDVGAVEERLEDMFANGATALHDAIITSLYYFRSIRGRRAMVLLSDGEDTSSTLSFREALEYAKRSGVSVYSIGLRIGKTDMGVRRKLEQLAAETGGRTFYIKEAAELAGTYAEIERELRSQYLIAYSSDRPGAPGQYHEITVKVKGGKLEARTMRGYYS